MSLVTEPCTFNGALISVYLTLDFFYMKQGNVLLNVSGNKDTLPPIINQMPFLTWIHSITAGVDHLMCPEISNNPDITLTNAKGVFSSSLAEYIMGACWYFAKDVPRLLAQQREREWNQFCVTELRGLTMGIVG